MNVKHGMSGTPEYKAWAAMLQRCNNPKEPAYENYGARGISVCDAWKTFDRFYKDMGSRPSDRHSLDRIDNDGHYTPDNCRWATKSIQQRNQRVRSDNKSGIKGVCFDRSRNAWIAYINQESKRMHKRFKTKAEAIEARIISESIGLVEKI